MLKQRIVGTRQMESRFMAKQMVCEWWEGENEKEDRMSTGRTLPLPISHSSLNLTEIL